MILHVACLPFPSRQGTQAAISSMLRASAEAGVDTHLLSYAHGAYELDAPYTIHRVPDFPRVRSLRSGPSWGKIALDVRCIAETRALAHRLRPTAIIAHHIEAALAALAADVGPIYYLAHTSLRPELPIYFPRLPAELVSRVGHAVERFVCERARRVGAVSPSLATLLGDQATYLPVPWFREAPGPTQREARAALGLHRGARIGLYAGNLDRYQGWEHLIDATARLRQRHPDARLLIATESETATARAEAAKAGIADAVDFRRLDGARARARVHAACDLAWVPRRTEGGLPIKMLDAFARNVPVVAMERATAGLPVHRSCRVVPDDDANALAEAAAHLFENHSAADALGQAGSRYLAAEHEAASYTAALRAWLDEPSVTRTRAKPPAPHRRAAPALRAR
jgi:glycosyltransferase involved in cell wall biosynthesis